MWKTVFHSTWKTFKSRFGSILNSLKRHRELLVDEKLNAVLLETQDMHDGLERQIQSLVRDASDAKSRQLEKSRVDNDEHRRRQLQILSDKLNAPNYLSDHENAAEIRRSSPSGDWILDDPTFKHWLAPDADQVQSIYLHAIPGAGMPTDQCDAGEHTYHSLRENNTCLPYR